ncbi:MAG: CDP-diacylglycerol--glycerol-3-phosphate 3-phosphatidyltransferase [Bryobacteraceae bacterium]|nr:CDP-diacylglycerol--glycerol-3-phosphate 3-phosphatidyltransferase [Bryobacteraceae bacterium]
MNLPNALTLLRIFFVPLLVAALVQRKVEWDLLGLRLASEMFALWIFLAAALTDLLDGYIARRWGQITTVGTLLDPIADKMLISAALISLVQTGDVPAGLTILLIGREFAISGLRSIAASAGYTIKASDLGKTKMVFQVLAISLVILAMRYPGLSEVARWSIWVVVFFSIASALSYFAKFWGKVDAHVKENRRRQFLQLERRRKRTRAAASGA